MGRSSCVGQKTLELKSLPEGSRDSVEKSITYGKAMASILMMAKRKRRRVVSKVELKEGLNGSMTSHDQRCW